MIVRMLALAAAVLAAPAAALACPAHAGGDTTASAGVCPHAAQAGGECPFASTAGTDAATCPHAQMASAGACEAHDGTPAKVTVAELARDLAAMPPAIPVDANTDKTRARDGVIPGAKLLTSSSAYDPARELGAAKDARLVFYCANTRCTASHAAAKRAIEAGYTNVAILPEGIAGWKAAGQKTAAVPRS